MIRNTLFRSGTPLLAALFLSAGLVGCGDQKDPNSTLGGGDDTNDTTTPPADTSTPDETPGDTSGANPEPGNSTEEPASSEPPEPGDSSGGADTSAPASTGGDDTSAPPADNGICPMVSGATWTYWHTSKGGWSETQTVTTGKYDGETVFIVADTPDPDASLRADSYIAKKDGKLVRLYKKEFWVDPKNPSTEILNAEATYGVGFTRCNEAWATAKIGWSESPEYLRVETPKGQAAKPAETRKHTFTVEAHENVKLTKSGLSFSDCVKVRRSKDWAAVDGEDADEKLYWYCPGVGKVREENVRTKNTEELTEYDIPE